MKKIDSSKCVSSYELLAKIGDEILGRSKAYSETLSDFYKRYGYLHVPSKHGSTQLLMSLRFTYPYSNRAKLADL